MAEASLSRDWQGICFHANLSLLKNSFSSETRLIDMQTDTPYTPLQKNEIPIRSIAFPSRVKEGTKIRESGGGCLRCMRESTMALDVKKDG